MEPRLKEAKYILGIPFVLNATLCKSRPFFSRALSRVRADTAPAPTNQRRVFTTVVTKKKRRLTLGYKLGSGEIPMKVLVRLEPSHHDSVWIPCEQISPFVSPLFFDENRSTIVCFLLLFRSNNYVIMDTPSAQIPTPIDVVQINLCVAPVEESVYGEVCIFRFRPLVHFHKFTDVRKVGRNREISFKK